MRRNRRILFAAPFWLVLFAMLAPCATARAGAEAHLDVTKALASAEKPRKKKLIDPALKDYAKELRHFPYFEFQFAGASGVQVQCGKKADVSLVKTLRLEIHFKSFDKKTKRHTLAFWVYKKVKNPQTGKEEKKGIARTTITLTPGGHSFLIVSDDKILKNKDLILILSLPKKP